MNIMPLELLGVLGIQSSAAFDERGSFLRIWDAVDFEGQFDLIQASAASNLRALTLRGLHFQAEPNDETKIVQCISGSVFDVAVDLREDSTTYRRCIARRIGPKEELQGLLIPKGFAHGYLTLEANSTLIYFMDQLYAPESARGIIWNDPALQIAWPSQPEVISDRDRNFPSLKNL